MLQLLTKCRPWLTASAKTVIIVSVALAMVALGISAPLQKQPSHQGKSLREWLEEAGSGRLINYKVTNGYLFYFVDCASTNCHLAMQAMGTNALPALREILRKNDSLLKNRTVQILNQLPGSNQRFLYADEHRARARAAVSMLGADALPLLLELVADDSAPEDSRAFAALALGNFPDQAGRSVPLLNQAATSPYPRVRQATRQAISQIGWTTSPKGDSGILDCP